MVYEIYIDVLVLINAAVCLLSLSLTGILMKHQTSFPKLLTAAITGSILSCIFLFLPISILLRIACSVLLGGSIMTMMAFHLRNPFTILRADGVLLISMILEGGMILTWKQYFCFRDRTILLFLLAESLFFQLGGYFLVQEKERGRKRYQVRLSFEEITLELTALCDSGNCLTDPGSGKPVSILSVSGHDEFLKQKIRIRWIPYRAVGTANGVLPAATMTAMEILKEDGRLLIEDPVVAFTKDRLSGSGDFDLLLPEKLLFS